MVPCAVWFSVHVIAVDAHTFGIVFHRMGSSWNVAFTPHQWCGISCSVCVCEKRKRFVPGCENNIATTCMCTAMASGKSVGSVSRYGIWDATGNGSREGSFCVN